jgi:hypothetical protein
MQRHKKALFVIVFLTIIICFITCTGNSNSTADPRGELYAGSATCVSCHKNIGDSYVHTSHYNSSSKTSYAELKGLIDSTNRIFSYINNQQVSLEDTNRQFFQAYSVNGRHITSQKMDIVFGSGKNAQTYGYWKDSQLYELPLTYLSIRRTFTNSPGYPIDRPYYSRVIPSRCLECHASFVNAKQVREKTFLQMNEKFDQSSLVNGIDCERCHGAGAQHVQFQNSNPNIKEAKFITKIKSLSRQQQLDLCATCHSGDPVEMRSIFAFKPGDTLSKYYLSFTSGSAEPDVHGMQTQLLESSKCFRNSNMTCITCHDPHEAKENIQAIINTCTSCHKQSIQHAAQISAGSDNNCITCHMPSRASKSLVFNNQTTGNNIPYMLRTHRIAIYPKSEWK